jgi:hypothetical protein
VVGAVLDWVKAGNWGGKLVVGGEVLLDGEGRDGKERTGVRLGVLKRARQSVRQRLKALKQKVAHSILGYAPPLIVDLGCYSFTTTVYLRPHDSGIGWIKGERLYECKIVAVVGKRVPMKVVETAAKKLREEGWGLEGGLLRSKEGFIVVLSPKQAIKVWRVWEDNKVYEVSVSLAGSGDLKVLEAAIDRIESLLKDPTTFNVDLTDPTLKPTIIEHYLRGVRRNDTPYR